MSKTATQLFFAYPSTAKIRIKKGNCYFSDEFPALYRIMTGKLDFTIPKVAVIFGPRHVYVPNDIYKRELEKYYSSIKNT